MLCNDPLVRAFRRFGYNVIRLPSAQFTPFLLLESDGKHGARVVGPVQRELPSEAGAAPDVKRDDPAPAITLRSTRKLNGRVATDFLAPVLAAMGIAPSVSIELEAARSITIDLHEVLRDWIEVGALGRYLESGVGEGSRHVQELAERGALFVVTAVLKSASFSATTDGHIAEKAGAAASVPGAVKVDVTASAEHADQASVSFFGTQPLAFAFQAVQLVYEDGEYSDFVTANGISGYALDQAQPELTEGMLLINDELAELA